MKVRLHARLLGQTLQLVHEAVPVVFEGKSVIVVCLTRNYTAEVLLQTQNWISMHA